MQPSMGILNSPSSRIVKDSTPSRRRILRYINFIFGHGESSPNNIWSMANLEWTCILLFYYFLCLKVNLDLEKNKSVWWIFTQLFFSRRWILTHLLKKKRWTDSESWPNDFVEKVNRGEDLRWVGSRCPLMHALDSHIVILFCITGANNSF